MQYFWNRNFYSVAEHWKPAILAALLAAATVAAGSSAQMIENPAVKPLGAAPLAGHTAPAAVPDVLGTKSLQSKPVNQRLIEQIRTVRDTTGHTHSSADGINLTPHVTH